MRLSRMYFAAAIFMLLLAAALVLLGKDGWGWFLVSGILMLPSPEQWRRDSNG